MAFTPVGEGGFVLSGASGTKNVDFSTVTGVDPIENDVVIIVGACDGAQPATWQLTAGYENLPLHNPTGTGPAHMVIAKRMGATPDTSVDIDYTTALFVAGLIQIWRGVDLTTITSGTPTRANSTTGLPDPPSQTTAHDNALRVITGHLDDDDAASGTTAPSGYTNLFAYDTGQASTSVGATVMIASKLEPTAGASDPAAFAGSAGTDAWFSHHFALRPAADVAAPNKPKAWPNPVTIRPPQDQPPQRNLALHTGLEPHRPEIWPNPAPPRQSLPHHPPRNLALLYPDNPFRSGAWLNPAVNLPQQPITPPRNPSLYPEAVDPAPFTPPSWPNPQIPPPRQAQYPPRNLSLITGEEPFRPEAWPNPAIPAAHPPHPPQRNISVLTEIVPPFAPRDWPNPAIQRQPQPQPPTLNLGLLYPVPFRPSQWAAPPAPTRQQPPPAPRNLSLLTVVVVGDPFVPQMWTNPTVASRVQQQSGIASANLNLIVEPDQEVPVTQYTRPWIYLSMRK